MTTFNMVSDCVRNDDGSINMQATSDKFSTMLQQYVVKREMEVANVSAAVDAVFDEYASARVNVPFVVGQALNKLRCTPATHQILDESIRAYIHENTGKTRDEGKKFTVKLGKGGGMQMWKNVKDEKKA
jgi:hypothetical protein